MQPILTITETILVNKIYEVFRNEALKPHMNYQTVKILLKFLDNNGSKQANYKYAKDKDYGRLFARQGIQGLPGVIRSALLSESHYDVDFVNCAPSILLNLATESNLIPQQHEEALKRYISSRQQVMEEFNITKRDVLVAMNDFEKEYKDTTARSNFLKSIQQVAILVSNSSQKRLSKLIEKRESKNLFKFKKMLEEAGANVDTLIFDGMIVSKAYDKQLKEAIRKWNLANPINQITIKPWEKVPETLIPSDRFDYGDKTTYGSIAKQHMDKRYQDPIEVFAESYITLQKVVKTVNGSVFYIKKLDRGYDIKKRLDIKFKSMGKLPINLESVLNLAPKLFYIQDVTHFAPTDDKFSLFPGFLPDLKTVRPDYEQYIQPILKHFLEVWADDDQKLYNFILDWFAAIVQYIPIRTETILLLQGDEGTGKSCLFEFIQNKILGNLCFTMTGCDKLTRNFNSHLVGKILVCLEELKGDTDQSYKHDLNRIKQIITSNKLDMERKGIDVDFEDNGINVIAFSNYENALPPVTGINRRLVCTSTSSRYKGNIAYFTALNKLLDDKDTPSSFLKFLLERKVDLTALRFFKPETRAKTLSRWNSLSFQDKTVYWIFRDPEVNEITIRSSDFASILPNEISKRDSRPSTVTIGKWLSHKFQSRILDGTKYFIVNRSSISLDDSLLEIANEYASYINEDQIIDINCLLDDN